MSLRYKVDYCSFGHEFVAFLIHFGLQSMGRVQNLPRLLWVLNAVVNGFEAKLLPPCARYGID